MTAAAGRHSYLTDAADLRCSPLRMLLQAVAPDCREAFCELSNKLNLAAIRTSTLKPKQVMDK